MMPSKEIKDSKILSPEQKLKTFNKYIAEIHRDLDKEIKSLDKDFYLFIKVIDIEEKLTKIVEKEKQLNPQDRAKLKKEKIQLEKESDLLNRRIILRIVESEVLEEPEVKKPEEVKKSSEALESGEVIKPEEKSQLDKELTPIFNMKHILYAMFWPHEKNPFSFKETIRGKDYKFEEKASQDTILNNPSVKLVEPEKVLIELDNWRRAYKIYEYKKSLTEIQKLGRAFIESPVAFRSDDKAAKNLEKLKVTIQRIDPQLRKFTLGEKFLNFIYEKILRKPKVKESKKFQFFKSMRDDLDSKPNQEQILSKGNKIPTTA